MLSLVFIAFSCSDNVIDDELNKQNLNEERKSSMALSVDQAKIYASMFCNYLDEKDADPESNLKTRSSGKVNKELSNIDYYIENGDTLLYAFNYKDDNGYIIIAADNSTFPILAHSSKGNLKFKDINSESSLNLFISAYKQRTKERLAKVEDTEYYQNWKDLGNKDYEYEIIPNNDEPIPVTKGRRKNSSGKKSIYPYTGIELDAWCQEDGYNYYAPNKARIGCPAIAIGMLMYDTSQRMNGSFTPTYPEFNFFYDAYNMREVDGSETARKLRQIADSIPNYNWGARKDAESGASLDEIKIGLRKLGYKNADYVGEEVTRYRGVLLAAWEPSGKGHIWFCDGYYEQSYTCKKKFLGITIRTWTEYDDRLYMNWGWGPRHGNGWYCATDKYWTSNEGNDEQTLKIYPNIYINLNYYEYPKLY